jgi:para-nitrobenzyl esterase
MLRLLAFLCACLAVCLAKTVTIGCPAGNITGAVSSDGTLLSFLGVPYVAPPVGLLRWRAPQPLEAVSMDAFNFSSICLQFGSFAVSGPQSEDCLYMNIVRPASISGLLPVKVWIHGGGFCGGSGSYYNVTQLALATGSLVITFNYRLGVFGYYAHPALLAESPYGNYGLQDQQALLRWVQRNIGAFGGDPDNVLIFGESAGGGSVQLHTLMSGSVGLFHRAVIESPGLTRYIQLPQTLAMNEAGLRTGSCWANGNVTAQVACLRALPTAAAYAALLNTIPVPVVDGYQLPGQPLYLLQQGAITTRVPIVIGSVAQEGNLFAYFGCNFSTSITESTFLQSANYIMPSYVTLNNVTLQKELFAMYFPLGEQQGWFRAFAAIQEVFELLFLSRSRK